MLLEKNSPEKSQIFLSLQVCSFASYCKRVFHQLVFYINTSDLFAESEPRDAGTDQRSSGIIRLHTIKQIIDRVSISYLLYKMHRGLSEYL